MFDKDTKKQPESEKAPTSFSNQVSSVVQKSPATAKTEQSTSTTLIASETDIFGDLKFSVNLKF